MPPQSCCVVFCVLFLLISVGPRFSVSFSPTMEFNVENFAEAPSVVQVMRCSKADLLVIADHYGIEVDQARKKAEVRSELMSGLARKQVLPDTAPSEVSGDPPGLPVPVYEEKPSDQSLRLRELEHELKLKEFQLREKQLNFDLEMRRLESKERVDREKLELDREVRLRELELGSRRPGTDVFDVGRHIRMVPLFSEKEVDKYFPHFERVATSLAWPKEVWTLLLQCVLTGKAQEVYSSLSSDDSLDFETVKHAVLRAYELVPEAYRQKFRGIRKPDSQTYVEFASEKENLFDRWCLSLKVTDFVQLRELMILEEFKTCLPEAVVTYLNEQKVLKVSAAAILAEEYILTHRNVFREKPNLRPDRLAREFPSPLYPSGKASGFSFSKKVATQKEPEIKERPVCFYCKKVGHVMSECFALRKKNARGAKPVGLINTSVSPLSLPLSRSRVAHPCVEDVLEDYKPFIIDGWVSLSADCDSRPVKMLRDTGAAQSFVVDSVLPFSGKSAIGSSVLIQGVEMGCLSVPLHSIHVTSPLVSGQVVVGIRPSLPVGGITFILGNDLAGGRVPVNPQVTPVPLVGEEPDELSQKYPGVFPACAVTRAMAKRVSEDLPCLMEQGKQLSEVELFETFMCDPASCEAREIAPQPEVSSPLEQVKVLEPGENEISVGNTVVPREQLKDEQKKDPSLLPLFDEVTSDPISDKATGYFVRGGVLMRKWCSPSVPLQDEWCHVFQVVVPNIFRPDILKLAHDGATGGHLGVNKTYDRVLLNFFWPGLKRDVVAYCKSCHNCQLAGKPNQAIPVSPLFPIPAFDEPFSRVLVDCVGPLPKAKSGNQYLLTIMCASTRFPEAVPLRNITAPTITKALVKFFSVFGLPRVVQSDQGSNFMS